MAFKKRVRTCHAPRMRGIQYPPSARRRRDALTVIPGAPKAPTPVQVISEIRGLWIPALASFGRNDDEVLRRHLRFRERRHFRGEAVEPDDELRMRRTPVAGEA